VSETVIIEAVRTPFGRKGGTLSSVRPDELYALVLNGLLKRLPSLDASKIEDVITGCVTQAGEQGANVGRIATLLSMLPKEVPAITLNRMCGSGQQAVHFAAQAIAAGDARYMIGGGVESMSRVQMFSDIGGGFEKLNPKLGEKYEIIHQGESAERIAEKYGISRAALDEFSMNSHRKAHAATQAGYFTSQLIEVPGADKEGKPTTLKTDEGIRATLDPAKMASLPPVFRSNGVVTAANSSQLSDGAAAVLIADKATAIADGLWPRASFLARVAVGGDPTLQLMEVVPATRKALERAKLTLADIDVIEINEAFASVVLAWGQELKVDWEKVNPNGGAIAHGHPLGATGAGLLTKLLHELERRDATFGLQVMCIGHGMATATIIERM
jgi:acetyl-CoA acetyltransferase family protein